MTFDPLLADIRFGMGLSPRQPPPADLDEMLGRLAQPDPIEAVYPLPDWDTATPRLVDLREMSRARRNASGSMAEETATAELRAGQLSARQARVTHFGLELARALGARTGLRERLVHFWADHFTVKAKNSFTLHLVGPYKETAIRPHLTGKFGDMLAAATLHPMMLDYLDQWRSMGPTSPRAGQIGRGGLNENLARELLELHTIGVDGPYTQADVRELAELLTGVHWTAEQGVRYLPRRAEPGAETVLGVTFSEEAAFGTVRDALAMLAAHPATAAHICGKLVTHFVGADADPDITAAMQQVWRFSDGDLGLVVAAMLSHPQAWRAERRKVKRPIVFVASALRALNIGPLAVTQMTPREVRDRFLGPIGEMGQIWERPLGPDGFSEAPEVWSSAQFLAARITWAMTTPNDILSAGLPDPRRFVIDALGPAPPESVAFAARAAETRVEGIGLVLSSPAFQRS